MSVTTLAPTTTTHGLPRVNLLPPEIAESRRLRRAKVGLGAAVLGCVAVVGVMYTAAHASVGSAQNDLDEATSQRTSLQSQVTKLAPVTLTYQQVAAREAMLTQAMGDEVQWSHYLNDLSLTLPSNVWLDSVAVNQSPVSTKPVTTGAAIPVFDAGIGTITFTGVAVSYDDIAVWLETLAKERGYANPYFTSSASDYLYGHPVVHFTSTVTVTTDAHSGRFAKPAGN